MSRKRKSENSENGGATTSFRVSEFRSRPICPTRNSEDSEIGGGTTIFRFVRRSFTANCLGATLYNFENFETGCASTVFKVFKIMLPAAGPAAEL